MTQLSNDSVHRIIGAVKVPTAAEEADRVRRQAAPASQEGKP